MELCANCGGSVLEGARFCPHCGARQAEENPPRTVVTEEARPDHEWVWCEVEWARSFRGSEFDARPLTPGAVDSLPRSPTFRWREDHAPPDTNADARKAHEELVRSLVAAGWEPVGEADPWYGERFRRPATWEPVEVPVERTATPRAARLGIAALTIASLVVIGFALLVLLGFFR
jgi:hypothetical protein